MKIAIASGKGGTGKTTVAVSLALSLPQNQVQLLDCDVEAPNAHLFLNPTIQGREDVAILRPSVDETRCDLCGRCAEVCQFNAIAVVGEKVLLFPELCHGCGGCKLACPLQAIEEVPHVIGVVDWGSVGEMAFAYGLLNPGDPMPPPIIRRLKAMAQGEKTVILDVSPGTSCPVVESLRGSDYCLLVTEPTPFGLHDLKLAVEVARELKLPTGVVVNRADIGDSGVERYCQEEGLPILMRIPFDRRIAEAYSRGTPLVEAFPDYKLRFRGMCKEMEKQVGR